MRVEALRGRAPDSGKNCFLISSARSAPCPTGTSLAKIAATRLTVRDQRPAGAQGLDSVLAVSHDGKSLFRVNADGGLTAGGTSGVGTIPASGAGGRMKWFPAKWAFRAGKVESLGATYWDSENIGTGSVAIGENNRASGNSSVAIGRNARANNK